MYQNKLLDAYKNAQSYVQEQKKFNGLGLSSISMACTGLALVISSPQEPLLQCALYVLC